MLRWCLTQFFLCAFWCLIGCRSNALFRCGGSAQLYSNRWSDRWLPPPGVQCRLALQWSSRTHLGSDDSSYRCVYQQEDAEGHRGVRLGKDLMDVAAKAIRLHLQQVGHRVLTWREIARFVAWAAVRATVGWALQATRKGRPQVDERGEGQPGEEWRSSSRLPSLSASVLASLVYSPTFSSPSLHPCIHAGGSGVLRAIQAALKLTDGDLEVATRVLRERGNVSSSSVFYQMQALLEEPQGRREGEGEMGGQPRRPLRKGDDVWLLAFGSGFKVNSALLRAL